MKDSRIEWTDHTFNPWVGCTKVSPGCAHCYAERLNNRMGWAHWGDSAERVRTASATWDQPHRWDRQAQKSGHRAKVFCASLADWLDGKVPTRWLVELLALVGSTPHLDWLLLTKRPEQWKWRMGEARCAGSAIARAWLEGDAPANVWLGTSIEDQPRAEERIPEIVEIPARVKFLSVEPLLGPLDLSYWLTESIVPQVRWVIVGGESGPGAREMRPEWVRALRAECAAAGVAFFFKQWGGVRKGEAGRTLDGKTYDQFPGLMTNLPHAETAIQPPGTRTRARRRAGPIQKRLG